MIDVNRRADLRALLAHLPAGAWYPRATDDGDHANARFVSTEPGPLTREGHWTHDQDFGFGTAGDSETDPRTVVAIVLLQYPPLAVLEDADHDAITEFIAEAKTAMPELLDALDTAAAVRDEALRSSLVMADALEAANALNRQLGEAIAEWCDPDEPVDTDEEAILRAALRAYLKAYPRQAVRP